MPHLFIPCLSAAHVHPPVSVPHMFIPSLQSQCRTCSSPCLSAAHVHPPVSVPHMFIPCLSAAHVHPLSQCRTCSSPRSAEGWCWWGEASGVTPWVFAFSRICMCMTRLSFIGFSKGFIFCLSDPPPPPPLSASLKDKNDTVLW